MSTFVISFLNFSKVLRKSKRPVIIIGSQPLASTDGKSVHAMCANISNTLKSSLGNVDENWRVLNVLHKVRS